MPNKELLKQLEIEKQKRGMSRSHSGMANEPDLLNAQGSEHRYAWEYELEAYRSQKRTIKWLAIGALCGVTSLVLEIAFHWSTLMGLTKIWPLK